MFCIQYCFVVLEDSTTNLLIPLSPVPANPFILKYSLARVFAASPYGPLGPPAITIKVVFPQSRLFNGGGLVIWVFVIVNTMGLLWPLGFVIITSYAPRSNVSS